MPIINPTQLIDLTHRIFLAAGASPAAAAQVAASLVLSDQVGHGSHGVVRVRQYLDSIAAGNLNPAATPHLAHETAVVALVDGGRGFGQVTARFAIKAGVAKARAQGLAAAGTRNCGHVGRLGEWVELAAREGLVCLAFCNGGGTAGAVAPFGGAARLLGTNPLAAAVPLAGRAPFVVDFATSAVAEGKLRIARNSGKRVPEGWILDADGQPSTDPNDFYAGGVLLPTAGHKGYGLALLVEFMGGLLTGQGSPVLPGFSGGNGVLFIMLAVEHFRTPEDFLADGAALAARVKQVRPAAGFDEVLLPGEPEQRAAQHHATGVPIDDTTWAFLQERAAALGMAL